MPLPRVHRRDRRLDDVADVREAARLEPSPKRSNGRPSARHMAIRVNAMSGRCRGPYALKYLSTTTSRPKLTAVARARCSQPSFVIPYGETGRGGDVLRRRVRLGIAVDRRRRREHDADAVPRRRLEQALRREHVAGRDRSRRRRRSCARPAGRRGGRRRRTREVDRVAREIEARGRRARPRSPPSARRRSSR